MANIKRVNWYGCFDGSWTGNLVPDAFAHPAKAPFGLAERIYRHMLAEGWIKPGQKVIDPFGGVACLGFHAMLYGLHWEGVELEARFVALAEQNIALWNERYAAHMPNWGTARIRQGDSRRLASILAGAQGSVSSPPYGQPGEQPCASQSAAIKDYHAFTRGDGTKFDHQMTTPGNLAGLPLGTVEGAVSSPPYAESAVAKNSTGVDLRKQYETYRSQGGGASFEAFEATQRKHSGDYGTTPGQLGALPQGEPPAGCVSSPPYSDALSSGEGPGARYDFKSHSPGNAIKQTCDPNYGDGEGQLGAMPTGDFEAAVSSPPYADGAQHTGGETRMTSGQGGLIRFVDYGDADGNLANLPAGDLDAAISSPPYAESLGDGSKSGIDWSKQADRDTTHPHGWNGEGYTQIGGVVSSPPYSETRIDGNGDEGASGLRNQDGSYLRGPDGWERRKAMGRRYGETEGNLGNLPAGCVSSPPYADAQAHPSIGSVNKDDWGQAGGDIVSRRGLSAEYADNTPGQLGAMSAGDYDAAVSSPPYAGSINQSDGANDAAVRRERKAAAGVDMANAANVGGPNSVLNRPQVYGETDGQLGAQDTDTFWSAAKTIVEQTYAVLKPGAVAAWICGDFVRNKKRVPFGEQWLQLCVSVGFEPLLWAVAWKHEDHGVQLDIEGNPVPLTKSRISFFRRLANSKNPEAAILNEDVIFVVKPYAKE